MNRLQELREQIAQKNKGKHYLVWDEESLFVAELCAEIDAYRKDINGILEECGKHISLSNDLPWTEEVCCAFRNLEQVAQQSAPTPQKVPTGEKADLMAVKIWEFLQIDCGTTEENAQQMDGIAAIIKSFSAPPATASAAQGDAP